MWWSTRCFRLIQGPVSGGARERRGSVAVRHSWTRIRSITWVRVMQAMMRISCPQRGQRSGSTSKRRRSSSAQRRRASWSEGATDSASSAGGCSGAPALRRKPRVRLVPLEDGDTLGLEYLLVPAWFAETFVIDHANARAYEAGYQAA